MYLSTAAAAFECSSTKWMMDVTYLVTLSLRGQDYMGALYVAYFRTASGEGFVSYGLRFVPPSKL